MAVVVARAPAAALRPRNVERTLSPSPGGRPLFLLSTSPRQAPPRGPLYTPVGCAVRMSHESSMNISSHQVKSFSSWHAGALAVGATAAATALWVEVRVRRAGRDRPAMGKFIYIDGTRVHYVMRGAGPPVVLLHGNSVTHGDFEASDLFDRLARDHQVIAFDRPGFGHSSRPRIRLWTPSAQVALLHKAGLGIERPVVVGHSMGAMVALAMGLDYPGNVSSLVLIGGYYYPKVRVEALLTAPVALPVLGDLMRYTVTGLTARALLDRTIRGMFAPNEVPPGFYPAVPREMMLRRRGERQSRRSGITCPAAAGRTRAQRAGRPAPHRSHDPLHCAGTACCCNRVTRTRPAARARRRNAGQASAAANAAWA